MKFKLDPIALATKDGVVTGMSNQEQRHPLYGTPSFEVRVSAKLDSVEGAYAEELLRAGNTVETIRYSIRNWAAQLGLAAFNPECTEVQLRDSALQIETLVSDISGKEDDVLISSLRRNAEGFAKIARAVLLFPGSKVDGRQLPLSMDAHYAFDREGLPSEELDAIWHGKSGREGILPIRDDLGAIPDVLDAGQYFVGEVEANPSEYCWLLEPQLMRGNQKVPVLHDQSCLFDPVRTTGRRQIEIKNTNSKAESLRDLSIAVSIYWTNLALFHCEHKEGV